LEGEASERSTVPSSDSARCAALTSTSVLDGESKESGVRGRGKGGGTAEKEDFMYFAWSAILEQVFYLEGVAGKEIECGCAKEKLGKVDEGCRGFGRHAREVSPLIRRRKKVCY